MPNETGLAISVIGVTVLLFAWAVKVTVKDLREQLQEHLKGQ